MTTSQKYNSTPEEPLPPSRPRPTVLLLLDGWGVAPFAEANAIANTKTPTFSRLLKEYPAAILEAGDKTINARYLSLGAGGDCLNEEENQAVTLTKVLAANNLKQLKITETERLAALTHFFNGHEETRAAKEDWQIISSETGDHTMKPTLALKRIIKKVLAALDDGTFDFLVVSIPTLDLVAQSGDFSAVQKAVSALDKNLRKIVGKIQEKKGVLIISAAHGNAEKMRQPGIDIVDKGITANPVPLVLAGEGFKDKNIGWPDPPSGDLSLLAPLGNLSDLAPTILDIMGLAKPGKMAGRSLIGRK